MGKSLADLAPLTNTLYPGTYIFKEYLNVVDSKKQPTNQKNPPDFSEKKLLF